MQAFIPNTGRGVQGATSHCLGQNFAKMFEINFENENREKGMVWQNSWAYSTRTVLCFLLSSVLKFDSKSILYKNNFSFFLKSIMHAMHQERFGHTISISIFYAIYFYVEASLRLLNIPYR